MTGLIWFVQIVHYPLFRFVGDQSFSKYEESHTRRTTWVVAAPMLCELGTGILLVISPDPLLSNASAYLGLGCLVALFASTIILQVPRHEELSSGFSERSWRRLVRSNWVRTGLWSFRSLLLMQALVSHELV